jgi:hypothetical protein
MSGSPVWAWVRFELVRWLRSRTTTWGAGAFALTHGLGWWRSPEQDHLFGYAFLGMFALSLRPGLSVDRELGFRDLLVWNTLGARRYALGKFLSCLASLALMVSWAGTVALGLSRGDFSFAAWHVVVFGLVATLLLPIALGADIVLSSRLPGVVALAATLLVGVLALSSGIPPTTLLELAGLEIEAGEWASLAPLARRGAGALVMAWLIVRLPAGGRLDA